MRLVSFQMLPLIVWAIFLSLFMFACCEFARWRQLRREIPQVQDRIYQLLIGFAVVIISRGVLDCWEFQMSPMEVRLEHLWWMVRVGGFPLFLWTLFHLPLSLARKYTRTEPRVKSRTESHPLDGNWAAQESFLDRIAAQAQAAPDSGSPSAGQLSQDRLQPLTRIARLQPGQTPSTPANLD